MKVKVYYILAMLLFVGCNKPQTCPVWNADEYNTVASALCNYQEDSCENAMVAGWMYEKHSTAEESFPNFYLSDTKDDDSQFIIVKTSAYAEWNPDAFRGVKLYITGSIRQISLPENGYASTAPCLFATLIDTIRNS